MDSPVLLQISSLNASKEALSIRSLTKARQRWIADGRGSCESSIMPLSILWLGKDWAVQPVNQSRSCQCRDTDNQSSLFDVVKLTLFVELLKMQMTKMNAIALVLKGFSHWQWFVTAEQLDVIDFYELEIWGNGDDATLLNNAKKFNCANTQWHIAVATNELFIWCGYIL